MPRRSRRAEALAVTLAMAACRGRERMPSQPPARIHPASPVAPRASVVPHGRGAQVITDISEGIRGFAPSRSTALATLHAQVIDASLSSLGLNSPFQRCAVDEAVRCDPTWTAAAFGMAATYRGGHAALHRVLRPPPAAPRPDQQQPDPLDPWRVSVLVTDGFETSERAFQPDAPGEVACTAGADPSCLAALLRQRVNQGYGIWVGRVVLPFDGRYFAERPLDAAMFARVTDHAAALNVDPAWNGVAFVASDPALGSESGAFRWRGARPLLVFVLTRDTATGRALVAEMERRLGAEHLGARNAAADVAFAEWAPFEGLSATVRSAARATNGGAADEVLVDGATRDADGLHVQVRCSVHGRAGVRLDGAVNQGIAAPPPFARIALGWRVDRSATALRVPPDAPAPRAGVFSAIPTVDCTEQPGGTQRVVLGLWAEWTFDAEAFSHAWFVEESAANSYETPEKVFGLADLARSVVTAGIARRGYLDRVMFDITRR